MTSATSSLVAQTMVQGSRFSIFYAQGLAGDIPADRWAEMSIPNSNHPAFNYAHLAIYPNKMFALLGRDDLVVDPFFDSELVNAGSECKDDASIYPTKDEIMPYFTERYEAVCAYVETLTADELGVDNPMEGGFKEKFPTLGSAISFMLNNHIMMHAGQISAWRRSIGLGSAM